MAIGNESFNGELAGAKGLATQRLFDTRADNDDERFERLEAAVQKLRDDFDAVSPSINRLIAIEREIQTLVDQLQVLVENDGNVGADPLPVPPVPSEMLSDSQGEEFPDDPATPAQSVPVPLAPPPPPAPTAQNAGVAPPPPPAAAPPPATVTVPAPAGSGITGIRIADHDKSTRVVIEAGADLPYTAAVDPENILIVSFTSGVVGDGLSKTSTGSKMIKSVDVTPQASGGAIIAMPLAKSTKIVRQGVLKPDGQNKSYRIYIDIQR